MYVDGSCGEISISTQQIMSLKMLQTRIAINSFHVFLFLEKLIHTENESDSPRCDVP